MTDPKPKFDPNVRYIKIGNTIYEQRMDRPRERTGIEPTYEGGATASTPKIAKWQKADGLQLRMLQAVDRDHYASGDVGKGEKAALDEIVANSLPMAKGNSDYPEEWIENCIGWVVGERQKRNYLPISALIGAVKKNVNKQRFLSKWSKNGATLGKKDQPRNTGF